MRKIFLFAVFLILISGFVLLSYKIVKEKWRHKLLSPISDEIFSSVLVKNVESGSFIIQNMPQEFTNEVVASISGVTVIFPKISDYSELIKTLQTILSGATMERKIIEIDLRFDKPVVKYGP